MGPEACRSSAFDRSRDIGQTDRLRCDWPCDRRSFSQSALFRRTRTWQSSLMLLSFAARIPGEMPLVPLFDEFPSDDSSHRVRAPGGYETWRMIALDQKQNLLLTAS